MSPSDIHGPSAPAGEPPRKSTLFCPECGHGSPIDGDWRRRTGAEIDRYDCPICETTVTTRPHPGTESGAIIPDGDRPTAEPRAVARPDLLRSWTVVSATWLGLWRRLTRPVRTGD